MNRIVTAPLLASFIFATQTQAQIAEPVPVSKNLFTHVKSGMASALRDPESARYGKMSAARLKQTGDIVVCGYINAKNGFGGYGGEQPFVGILYGKKFTDIVVGNGDRFVNHAIYQSCAKAGLLIEDGIAYRARFPIGR